MIEDKNGKESSSIEENVGKDMGKELQENKSVQEPKEVARVLLTLLKYVEGYLKRKKGFFAHWGESANYGALGFKTILENHKEGLDIIVKDTNPDKMQMLSYCRYLSRLLDELNAMVVKSKRSKLFSTGNFKKRWGEVFKTWDNKIEKISGNVIQDIVPDISKRDISNINDSIDSQMGLNVNLKQITGFSREAVDKIKKYKSSDNQS